MVITLTHGKIETRRVWRGGQDTLRIDDYGASAYHFFI